jgi:putative ABC transport system permease protein
MAVWKPLSTPPAEGMRDAVGQAHHIVLERGNGFWGRISYGFKWAIRDVFLNKVRFLMAVIAVIGCMMLLFAGFGVGDSMRAQVSESLEVELTHSQRATLIPQMVPNLGAETQYMSMLMVREGNNGLDDYVMTVVGEGNQMKLMSDGQAAPDDRGIYVTEGLADRLGITSGDAVDLFVPRASQSLSGTISGIIKSSTPQGFYVTSNYWESQQLTFAPNIALIHVGDEVSLVHPPQGLGQVIDRDAQINNGYEFVAGLEGIFMLIRVFAVVLAIVVLYSLGSLSFTERIREYATLKVLGYSNEELRNLTGRENIAATVIGLIIGIPAGFWFLSVYVTSFNTPEMSYYPSLTAVSMALAIGITTVSSLATTFLLGRRVRRIDMVEALKGVE